MNRRDMIGLAQRLDNMADALAELDPELLAAFELNGCAFVSPQYLRKMAGRLQAVTDERQGYPSRAEAEEENPGKATWTNNGTTFIP